VRQNFLFILVVFLFAVIGCKSEQTTSVPNNPTGDPLLDSASKVQVGRVIDGDTFVIGIGRDSFSVRIIGVDAFETKHGSRLDSQAVQTHISVDSAYALGQAGKHFADSLLSKQNVLLVRDYTQSDFDTYNRLLRHVYYYQGSATYDFGALMLQKKLALADTL
jgi:endonuclease YncB( thermonuclease family)